MGTVAKRIIGIVGAGLVLAGLARRRRTAGGRFGGLGPPPAGVREPRRPLQPSGSAGAAATPIDDA